MACVRCSVRDPAGVTSSRFRLSPSLTARFQSARRSSGLRLENVAEEPARRRPGRAPLGRDADRGERFTLRGGEPEGFDERDRRGRGVGIDRGRLRLTRYRRPGRRIHRGSSGCRLTSVTRRARVFLGCCRLGFRLGRIRSAGFGFRGDRRDRRRCGEPLHVAHDRVERRFDQRVHARRVLRRVRLPLDRLLSIGAVELDAHRPRLPSGPPEHQLRLFARPGNDRAREDHEDRQDEQAPPRGRVHREPREPVTPRLARLLHAPAGLALGAGRLG